MAWTSGLARQRQRCSRVLTQLLRDRASPAIVLPARLRTDCRHWLGCADIEPAAPMATLARQRVRRSGRSRNGAHPPRPDRACCRRRWLRYRPVRLMRRTARPASGSRIDVEVQSGPRANPSSSGCAFMLRSCRRVRRARRARRPAPCSIGRIPFASLVVHRDGDRAELAACGWAAPRGYCCQPCVSRAALLATFGRWANVEIRAILQQWIC
jgi:hypothetical protein